MSHVFLCFMCMVLMRWHKKTIKSYMNVFYMNVPLIWLNLVHPKIIIATHKSALNNHQQNERKFYSIVKTYYYI